MKNKDLIEILLEENNILRNTINSLILENNQLKEDISCLLNKIN